MEATALSVGKAVLDGALGYAKSVVTEEIALLLGVEGDVVFIGDELEMMQSFLMTADEEHDKHKVLLTWVKQVREVAYNVEDSLMDFSVHIDKRPSCWWCIPRTLWERRDIAKEVKELRAKVEDVSNRNLRYRLIKGSGSKPTTAEEQASIASVAMFGINEARRAAVEQEKSKMNLHLLVTNEENDLRVIAVWGTSSDLGKTSAIMEVYDDPMVNKSFGCRAWVSSMHPFNPKEFLQNMVRQFYENYPEGTGKAQEGATVGPNVLMKMENMGLSDMVREFNAKVGGHSYLIVIDDLSTIMEWDCMKKYFPDNKRRSRIIVSTQRAEIASLCVGKPHQVSELNQLSSDQTIYLFHKKVKSASDSTVSTSKPNRATGTATGKNPATSDGEIQEEDKDAGGDNVSMSSAERNFDRSKTIALADEVLTGRHQEIPELIKLIGQPDDMHDYKVISVWGMGGLGKTTLVRSVYRSQQLGGWKRAWVTALRPFNPEILIRSIVLQLQKDIQEDPALASGTQQEKKSIKTMELPELIQNLTRLLQRQKCLIVIDDLSSIEEWESIKENLAKARRIIVTTRQKGVAKHCSGEYVYALERLTEDAALTLFKQKVFKENTEKVDLWCDQDMMEQAMLILKKCGGLPLAISTISGFLATKPKTAIEWRKINDSISVELDINPGVRTIKTVLVRSYDGLPYHLKSCFLYFSIFPEDHKIKRGRVMRRWIAEGYSRVMHNMSAEEVGDKYFDELLDRSMILQGEDAKEYNTKVGSCQLHDMIREICISKAREENLVFTLEEGCSTSSTQGAIRHLAISSNWKRDKDVFERIIDLSRVRSLTVFGKRMPFFISKNMRFLRVLDLEDTHGINVHHLNQIGELIHLKYLSLRGCWGITRLPNSLGNLRNLQTLDIRETPVRELPTNITNLRKLQFLRADVKVPRGIEELNALCTLAHVNVYGKGIGSLKKLSQLYQLRKLGVKGIMERSTEEFWFAIASLNHLQSLSGNWQWGYQGDYGTLDGCLGGSLLLPRSIECLKLRGGLVKLTEWIHHLQNLSKLQLWESKLQQDAVQAVGKLPNLAVLSMGWNSYEGEELVFKQGSFPSLILLDLVCDFPFVKIEDGTMPKLELLLILCWEELQELSGLRYLTKLKEIRLDIRHSEKLKDNVQDQLLEHPNKDNISVTIQK